MVSSAVSSDTVQGSSGDTTPVRLVVVGVSGEIVTVRLVLGGVVLLVNRASRVSTGKIVGPVLKLGLHTTYRQQT